MTLSLQPSSQTENKGEVTPPHDATIPESTGDIIAYILERFHNGHRRDLPGLIVLARKVRASMATPPKHRTGSRTSSTRWPRASRSICRRKSRSSFPCFGVAGIP